MNRHYNIIIIYHYNLNINETNETKDFGYKFEYLSDSLIIYLVPYV
jgi:hypothetical protein